METYRGRIGTFTFATGNDVSTLKRFVNFSGGLKAVSVGMHNEVLLRLTNTEPFKQNGHGGGLLVSSSQPSGSVCFINMLLLIAGIEPNPGPGALPFIVICVAAAVTIFGITLFVQSNTNAHSYNDDRSQTQSEQFRQSSSTNTQDKSKVSTRAKKRKKRKHTSKNNMDHNKNLLKDLKNADCEKMPCASTNVAQVSPQSTSMDVHSQEGSLEQSRDAQNSDGMPSAPTDVVQVSPQSTPMDVQSHVGSPEQSREPFSDQRMQVQSRTEDIPTVTHYNINDLKSSLVPSGNKSSKDEYVAGCDQNLYKFNKSP